MWYQPCLFCSHFSIWDLSYDMLPNLRPIGSYQTACQAETLLGSGVMKCKFLHLFKDDFHCNQSWSVSFPTSGTSDIAAVSLTNSLSLMVQISLRWYISSWSPSFSQWTHVFSCIIWASPVVLNGDSSADSTVLNIDHRYGVLFRTGSCASSAAWADLQLRQSRFALQMERPMCDHVPFI